MAFSYLAELNQNLSRDIEKMNDIPTISIANNTKNYHLIIKLTIRKNQNFNIS
jgi:hypothetical protein